MTETEQSMLYWAERGREDIKNPPAGTDGHMIFNWLEWKKDKSGLYPKIHPTQKPVALLKQLIEIFTDSAESPLL